jgi:hypothetical protein
VKRSRKEMKTTLENRNKAITKFPRSAHKKKNRAKEARASSS